MALAAALATTTLVACDAADPLGLRAEPAREVVAPLEHTGRVVDQANLIDAPQERVLLEKLERVERDTMAQLVVVTTPSLQGYFIEDYSLALGRGWGIGDRERDDGVLLVIAPNERKVRIEVGYGLEQQLDDVLAAEIIEDMMPHFRNGQYQPGIETGVDEIGARLREFSMKEAA